MKPYGVDVVSAAELNLAEPEETGSTFRDNAALKAEAAARASGIVALADDSGLCVEALGGAPGIYSARWAGGGKDFGAAMARVERELKALGAPPPWRASFVSVLALAWPDGALETFEGRVDGRSSSRRAGRPGSATIRFSAPRAMTAPSARWGLRRSMGFPPTARLRSRIAPARSRSFRASGYERRARHRKERNPSRPQQNHEQNQAGGNKIQIRRNKIQMPVPSANRGFSIGYRPFQRSRAPLRRRGARLEGRSSARGARAGLWSTLRDAPSTLLGMRRWLLPRQSPPRRRSPVF